MNQKADSKLGKGNEFTPLYPQSRHVMESSNAREEKSLLQLRGSSVSTACSVVSLSLKAPQEQSVTVVSIVSAYG